MLEVPISDEGMDRPIRLLRAASSFTSASETLGSIPQAYGDKRLNEPKPQNYPRIILYITPGISPTGAVK